MQIYNLFLSAAARVLESPSEPVSWATAMQQGMEAIMRYVYVVMWSISVHMLKQLELGQYVFQRNGNDSWTDLYT